MHRANRKAVLELVRRQEPIARSQMARDLDLSLPTIVRIADELIAEDLIRPCGRSEATGGRPRPLLEFNAAAHAVIGVDLGGTKMLGAVTDLAGNVQQEVYLAHPDRDPAACLERLLGLVESLIQAPRQPGQLIRGIGVGAPGITLADEGVVVWSPNVGWRDLPLRAILTDRFKLPVFIENDVNLAALGELGYGAGREARNLVSIALGTGIGAGIIIDGALYRGRHQAAGEIGYLLPDVCCLGRRYDGFGALEGLASGTGIAERAREQLHRDGLPVPLEGLSAHEVFAAARSGTGWAQRIVEETVDYPSLAIAALGVILDPDVVVLGGGVAGSADLLIEPILRRLEGAIPYPPRLVASPLGGRSAILGATMLVLSAVAEGVSAEEPA